MERRATLPAARPRSLLRRRLRREGKACRDPDGPQANGVAERLVGTLRGECLDHLIVINERHLCYVLGEFVRHYNGARPLEALDLDVPKPAAGPPAPCQGPIVSLPVLGGLTHEYEGRLMA